MKKSVNKISLLILCIVLIATTFPNLSFADEPAKATHPFKKITYDVDGVETDAVLEKIGIWTYVRKNKPPIITNAYIIKLPKGAKIKSVDFFNWAEIDYDKEIYTPKKEKIDWWRVSGKETLSKGSVIECINNKVNHIKDEQFDYKTNKETEFAKSLNNIINGKPNPKEFLTLDEGKKIKTSGVVGVLLSAGSLVTKWQLIIQIDNDAETDKSKLEALLKSCPDLETDELYYHENSRYRGKKYEYKNTEYWRKINAPKLDRWEKFKKAYDEAVRIKNENVIQEAVDEAEANLREAMKNLIPKTEVNATEFYEKLERYRSACWYNEKLEFSADIHNSSSDDYISEKNTTIGSYREYKAAIAEADTLLDSLYTAEDQPSAHNVEANKAEIEQKMDAAIKKIEAAIENLDRKIGDSTIFSFATMTYKGIQLYANDLFNGQTDSTYLKARKKATEFLAENPIPNSAMGVREISKYYDIYNELRTAYRGIGKRSGKDITVKFSYVDAYPSARNKFQNKGADQEENKRFNAISEIRDVKLKAEDADVLSLLAKIGRANKQYGTINLKQRHGYIGNERYGIYINGVYQYIPKEGVNTIDATEMLRDDIGKIELNDGDEVTVVSFAKPAIKHFDEHGYQPKLFMEFSKDIRYQKLKLSDEKIVMGKPFEVRAEATQASMYHYKKDAKAEPVVGGEVYISRAYSTEDEARTGQIERFAKVKTGSDGKARLKLYEEGFYALNVFSPDSTEGWVCNGPALIFEVKKSDDIDLVRTELKAELDEAYKKYDKEYFKSKDWAQIETAYEDAKTKLEAATNGKDMADAVYSAVDVIQKIQKRAEKFNDSNLELFYKTLNKFSDNLESLDKAAEGEIVNLKKYYEQMTEYQRNKLEPVTQKRYEDIVAKQDKLPEAKAHKITIKANLDAVEGKDKEGLQRILDELVNSKVKEDKKDGSLVGGEILAKLFTANEYRSTGRPEDEKNGTATYSKLFTSFDAAVGFKEVYACVNPDYTAYLKVRDVDKNKKFNVLNIADGQISDEDISLDGIGDINNINARVLGKMSYIVNGNAYEVKDIKVKGTEKYRLGDLEFFDYSDYKGKTNIQNNMHVPNSFVIFDMPFEDVEIEVIFGSKLGTAEDIQSAKESAKASIRAAFTGYSKSDYSDANWAVLTKAKEEALQKIEGANDVKSINDARKAGLAAMATVKKESQVIAPPIISAPDAGDIKGRVHISVRNDTFAGGAWRGEILDGWYELGEKDTMMVLILKALKEKGFSWNGTVGMKSHGGIESDDYGITYLAYIYKDENKNGKWDKGEKKLGEFDGEGGSGWMGTLNDWFTNEGFQSFSYKNGWLTNNDEISVMFTQDLGVDLGGTWGNSDTRLKDLGISGAGKLVPNFSPDVYTYDLILPNDKANVVVTPTAMNKNYLVKTFLNLYNNDGSFYKRPETIGVKAGDVLYIGCGDRSWPSMNKQGAEARYYTGTKYTIRVQTAGVGSIESRIKELPEAKRITVNNCETYADRVIALHNQYEALSTDEKAKISEANQKTLKEVYEKVKFFSDIVKVKNALAALPNEAKATDDAVRSAKSDIEKADNAYKALSTEQKKYITIADTANYNKLVERLKTLKVETSAGSISGSEQAPVSNVIEPKAEVKGGTATAKLDVNAVNKVITEAAKAGEKKIIIEPQGTENAKAINVSIPKASAEMLAAQKDMSVSVETKSGQVNIPAQAMDSIVKEAKGSDISITIALKEKSEVKDVAASKLMENKNAVAVEVKIESAGRQITKFASPIEIMLPVNEKFEVGKAYPVTQISADGSKANLIGKCVNIGGKMYIKLSVDHLSIFVVNPEAATDMPFTDVQGHWAYEAIKYAFENKLMLGVSDDKFSPQGMLSRAMLTTILYRVEKEPKIAEAAKYKDVEANAWYANAVAWASREGIVAGYSESTFAPNDQITREQMAAMLQRYSKYKKLDANKSKDLSSYKDVKDVSDWASEAVKWSVAEELIAGRTKETLVPKGKATRAEAATILKNYMENIVKSKATEKKADDKAKAAS